MNMKYYFDYAAATPISDEVLSAMQPYYSELFYNPSALYLAAQEVSGAVLGARETVSSQLGCKTSEIIFVSGGTESNNLAINGIMQQFPDGNVITSAVEHSAVLEPAKLYKHKITPVKPDGRVDIDKLKAMIDDQTVLLSVMYANNEIGTLQPIKEIAQLINQVRNDRKIKSSSDVNYQALPIYLHTDACQASNYLPLLVSSLNVDLMTLNGGKIYGPKQSGILYVRTGVKLKPQILGGGQERDLRSGTENVVNIIGFAAALEETSKIRNQEAERLGKLQNYFIEKIGVNNPKITLNGSKKHRLPNNIHITIPGVDNERLLMELDLGGLMVATGSACSASSDEPSHVLKAIGLTDVEARSSLRISLGRKTDLEAVDKLLSLLP